MGDRLVSTTSLRRWRETWGKGGDSFAMSDRTWGLPEVVDWTLKLTGPATVDVCTYSLGVGTVNDCLFWVKAGRAERFRFVVHERLVASRKGRGWSTMLRRLTPANIRAGSTHAKFAIIEAPGWSVAVVTSGNMNPNRAIEHFAWQEGADRPAFQAVRAHFDDCFATLPEPEPPKTEMRIDRGGQDDSTEHRTKRLKARPKRDAGDDVLAGLLDSLS